MLKILFLILFCLLFANNLSFGKEVFLTRLVQYQKEKNSLKKSQLLLDLATESESANFYLLEPEATKMLQFGLKRKNKEAINSAKMVLAIILLNKGKLDLAREYLLQSKSYFSRQENADVVAIIYNYLGHSELKSGRFRDAIESYEKAKQLWESMDKTLEANLSNSFIATTLIQTKQLEKAKKIFEECIKNLLPFRKNRALSGYYSQLGEVFSAQKKPQDAAYNFDKGTEFAYKTGDPATIARAQNYSAISRFYKGDTEGALAMFKNSLEYRIKSGDVKLICEGYYNIGSLYQEMKNYAQAEEYFRKSILEAKKHTLLQDEADALLELSNMAKAQKSFDQSLIYLASYVEIKEKIFNQFKTDNQNENDLIEFLDHANVLEKANLREENLKNKLMQEKSKIKIMLGVFLVTLAGTIFLLKRSKSA